jgi:hypothetical protein
MRRTLHLASALGFAGISLARSTSPISETGSAKVVTKPRGKALANVGRNHPDYGMTVSEHEAAKRERQHAEALTKEVE